MRSLYPIKLVGDVLTLQYGKPLPESERTSEFGVPAYGANGVLCQSKQAFRTNASIIVGRKGSAGEINLTEGPFWPTDVTYFVEHDERASDLRYLFYALKLLNLQKLAKGVKPGINRNDVYALKIPMPSLPEQKRIVAILDEAFEGIDTAIANAEKNLANARELFDSCLQTIFSRPKNGWVNTTLGNVCELQNGFAFKGELFKPEGVQVLRISSIQNGEVCDNRPVFTNPADYREDLSKYIVSNGDLLIAMSGATTGKVGFNKTGKEFLLNQRVGKFRPGMKLNKKYLYYFLYTKVEEHLAISAGSAQPNLSKKQIKELIVPLPDMVNQLNIVEKITALDDDVALLKAVYERKLAALFALKQAILYKAFSGSLTSAAANSLPEAAE